MAGVDGATDVFVREHDAWVKGIAKSVARELRLQHAMEDLVAYGMAGMLEARTRYAGGPVPFQGFAYYRVRGAILDGAYRVRGLTRRHLVATMQALDAQLEDAAERRQPLAPGDTTESALNELDVLVTSIADAKALAMMADETAGEDASIAALDRERVYRAIAALPERERIAIEGVLAERSLDDIGAELRLSRSWVSRLYTRGIRLLRQAVNAEREAETGGDDGSGEEADTG